VQECLWMNFPEPTELHDWRFAGRNFRERCALKRLATRWMARLDDMPPRKRGYVMNALAASARNGIARSQKSITKIRKEAK
jgi:DNA adenine methylase